MPKRDWKILFEDILEKDLVELKKQIELALKS